MLRFHSKRKDVEKIEIQKNQAIRMVPGQPSKFFSHTSCWVCNQWIIFFGGQHDIYKLISLNSSGAQPMALFKLGPKMDVWNRKTLWTFAPDILSHSLLMIRNIGMQTSNVVRLLRKTPFTWLWVCCWSMYRSLGRLGTQWLRKLWDEELRMHCDNWSNFMD